MKLVFATKNEHKLNEIRNILGGRFTILSLDDIECRDELPETQDTLEGNAIQKAKYVYDKFRINCFADDTGLEVDALGGEPGVYSARYAGENVSFQENVDKLLSKMEGQSDRRARFRTVIALILDGKLDTFEGEVVGTILSESKGSEGFGYDPVFQPRGFSQSFAEMDSDKKNSISHRYMSSVELAHFLSDKVKK